MWFSNTTRNLANELNQWLEHLLSQHPPAGERPYLQRQPQLLGSCLLYTSLPGRHAAAGHQGRGLKPYP